jgi:hypothetical protein
MAIDAIGALGAAAAVGDRWTVSWWVCWRVRQIRGGRCGRFVSDQRFLVCVCVRVLSKNHPYPPRPSRFESVSGLLPGFQTIPEPSTTLQAWQVSEVARIVLGAWRLWGMVAKWFPGIAGVVELVGRVSGNLETRKVDVWPHGAARMRVLESC